MRTNVAQTPKNSFLADGKVWCLNGINKCVKDYSKGVEILIPTYSAFTDQFETQPSSFQCNSVGTKLFTLFRIITLAKYCRCDGLFKNFECWTFGSGHSLCIMFGYSSPVINFCCVVASWYLGQSTLGDRYSVNQSISLSEMNKRSDQLNCATR